MKREEKSLLEKAGIAVVREKTRPITLRYLATPSCYDRRDGRVGASADRGQRCRPAVESRQGLFKAQQITKTRHLGEACSLAQVPHRKACGPGAGRAFSMETSGDNVRSREISDRSGCGTYRRVRRSHQRPERG